MIQTDPSKLSGSIWLVAAVAGIMLANCASTFAQVPWPEKMKNPKVLSKSTTTAELRTIMFGFSNALGVDCVHCHVAENRNDFSTYDFASDKNDKKISARTMMHMVKEINDNQLTKVVGHKAGTLSVDCMTCHHGKPKPVSIVTEMISAMETDGIRAAIERYRALREKYYGKGSYDFSENSLNVLGYQLLQKEQVDDAIAVFQLNVEMNPAASNPYDSLAEAYMRAGRKWLAFINYSKSLQLNPRNRNAEKMLNELKEILNDE